MAGLEIKHTREIHIWKWLFNIFLVIALIVTGWYLYRWYTYGETPPIPLPVSAISALPKVDETDVTDAQRSAYSVPATHPRYISIPSLDIVNARVMAVGLDETGNLKTPANIHDVAWYDQSSTPGSGYGAVMIDGHSGGYSKDGVFSKLGTLHEGDTISVERGDGKKITYIVTSNRTMSLDEVNKTGMKELLQSPVPDKEALSLITCAGNYVPKLGQFDKRVMLQAVAQTQSGLDE